MRARHRLSKLLLRYGLVSGGRQERLDRCATTPGCACLRADTLLRSAGTRSAFDAGDEDRDRGRRAPRPIQLRDRSRWPRTSEFTPTTRRLGCSARDLHPDRVRARGRDRRLGPGSAAPASAPSSASHPLEHSSGSTRSPRDRSPRPATATPADCSSKPPGTTDGPTSAGEDDARPMGARPDHRCRGPRGCGATGGCTDNGLPIGSSPARKRGTKIAAVATARELAGWCWSLANPRRRCHEQIVER